ncbi:hypothetical protein ACG2F4_06610 [Halalkalibaculum sp. DA3122]|uniref:hypothetical protein n=1 Tax=Halalkalibaculum sp. DA3122 TaxID=3373607 RepID=UPI0037545A27
MKQIILTFLSFLCITVTNTYAQSIGFNEDSVEAVNVFSSIENILGKKAIKVIKNSAIKKYDEPTFVKVNDVDFQDGTIQVKVLSRLTDDAPDFARGFIGIAFRINQDNSEFESIYLRPTNARSDDQLRRNHSIQYFSYPDYKFDRLRDEDPGKYESYADMELNKWIQMKVVVKGEKAELYLNDKDQPSLVVDDLKHGNNASGAIGLWVDVGTEGYFTDLEVKSN